MIGRIRNKLRLVRYYSASRPRTVWTTLGDAALIASLFLSFPAAWGSHVMVGQTYRTETLGGQLIRMRDQTLLAVIMAEDSTPPPLNWRDGDAFGNFVIERYETHFGWPLTTGIAQHPPRVNIDIRGSGPQSNVSMNLSDPIHAAIATSLDRDQRTELLTAITQSAARIPDGTSAAHATRQQWVSWVIASGIWWLMLAFAMTLALRIAEFSWKVVVVHGSGRKARLRAQNRCVACGYDLTGLDFNERCPECGELVW